MPAVDLTVICQQGALLVPSATSIKGFKSQLTGPEDSCQFNSLMYGDKLIDGILKEYPEELRARRNSLNENTISL